MHDSQLKINKLVQELTKKKIDAVIIYNLTNKDKHFYYFTELDIEYCFLVILAKQKKVFVLTSILEAERVKKALPYEVITITKSSIEKINEILKENNVKSIAVNYNAMTLNEYNRMKPKLKYKWHDCSQLLAKIRQQKTEQEINYIQKACAITDKTFSLTVQNFNKFKTEVDVAQFIKQTFHQFGVEESFPTIAASGKNAALPHAIPENLPLNKGFCVIDFGCKYKEYASDMTRTIYIGSPTKEEQTYYKKIQAAKKAAEQSVKLNANCSIPDKAARKSLGALQTKFFHALGHGLGLDVHETPHISLKADEKFLENTVFTIEPGIYFKEQFGIRIEDDYVISKNGLKKLSNATEELIIINK